ncbi:MAG: acetyl/propionyl/methylcrotonyl-CoA carboxylase subunit alpha [Pseudonocardiaceae bacterium]
MFESVLVANRGEIAVRVIRTLRAMGIRAVAVYSDADAAARHVAEADIAVRLGPAPAAQSYLSIERILDAAARTDAQAVHPGYGFLSENPAFARACAQAGLIFVGPPAAVIEAMGDKIRAKQTVATAGVPVVPGSHSAGFDDAGFDDPALTAAAGRVGFPVLLKPSAGGGGKGMRVVRSAADLPDAIAAARREARSACGDDTLLVERLVANPRHIEIQVLADAQGGVVHLGERECSLQRRHQKIVEEAPSVLLDATTRARMGESAVAVAKAVGYVGAGTVEFIVDGGSAVSGDPEFFFLEMNTRLQVEHPVTELITGLDLVELQLRVAAGEPLPLSQDDIAFDGHAVQARIYAEDPARGFLPTGGPVLHLAEPTGPGVRVDSGLVAGGAVGSDYDPMLAKVIAHGPDRDTALRRLDAALGQTSILGLRTNTAFLRALLADPDVAAGRLDTGLVERRVGDWVREELPDDVLAAGGLLALLALEPSGPVVDPFALPGGWRIGEPAWTRWRVLADGHDPVEVRARGRARAAHVAVGESEPVPAAARWDGPAPVVPGPVVPGLVVAGPVVPGLVVAGPVVPGLVVTVNGTTRRYSYARDGAVVWLGRDGHSWALREQAPLDAVWRVDQGSGGPVLAPMPGTVTVVDVVESQRVSAGTRLLVVEAMKMEHALIAPVDGVVRELRAHPGSTVERDAVLLTLVSA